MSQIQKFESNLHEKYAAYKTQDKSSTDNKQLNSDQLSVLEMALNATWANPKFKMKHFVTSGQITPYSTLKQYMLELKTLEESFENFEYGINKLTLEVELLEITMKESKDPLKIKEAEIACLEKRHHLKQNRRRIHQLQIEREQYLELIKEFLEGPDGKTEDGRSLMEVFGTPEEDKYEKEYWTIRLARQAAMDISSYGTISAGNLDAIHQLPEDMCKQSIALAHHFSLANNNLSNELKSQVLESLTNSSENKSTVRVIEHKDDGAEEILDVYRS